MGVPRRREGGGDVLAVARISRAIHHSCEEIDARVKPPRQAHCSPLHLSAWRPPRPLTAAASMWSTGIYNPRNDVTQDATTLYASDRDVFLFLVDDLTRPTRSRRNISPRRTRDRAAPRRRPPRRLTTIRPGNPRPCRPEC